MSGRVLISLCLAALAVALPQQWQAGQQQANGYNGNGNGNGYGTNGNGNGYGTNGNGNGARQLQPQQPQQQQQQGQMMPMNYDFQWEVNDEESGNFYGHKEEADNGRVDGSYHVFLPDGRLMRVEYYVDGDSGFVPTITYENPYTPTWGTPYYTRRR